MKLRTTFTAAFASGCVAAVLVASPALAAAPATATVATDAGTTCALSAAATVSGGLLGVSPIGFSGGVDCSPADLGNAPLYSGSANLSSNLLGLGDQLPLDLGNLGGATAQPNSPSNVAATPPPPGTPAGEGGGFVCRVDPGYDCGSTGRMTGLPATPYQVTHFATFTAPAAETWTTVPDGCQIGQTEDDAVSAVSCIVTTDPFTTG